MAPGSGACDHSETMSTTIQLLGRPSITRGSSAGYKLRSRKSWGLLAYLILSERPVARSQLASLLFAEADDPVRALRWCLAEIRRALGDEGSVDGDPLVLRLPPGAVVDVQVVMKGTWTAAVGLPGLGADLLDGMTVKGGAAFETWLLAQQRHAAAASEAVLHEAALGSMARARGGHRLCRPRRRDEPARREPPGPADPAVPDGWRRRGRGQAVRRVR